MPNNKRIVLDWCESGINVYCVVRREADDFLLNFTDGNFYASPSDPYLPMTENATLKGRYEINENRQTWANGRYTIAIYARIDLTPSPLVDEIIGTGEMMIFNDIEVSLDAPITSRAAPGAQMALLDGAINSNKIADGAISSAKVPDLEFLSKFFANKKTWDDINKRWDIYDDAGTTVIYRWKPRTKSGGDVTMPDDAFAATDKVTPA